MTSGELAIERATGSTASGRPRRRSARRVGSPRRRPRSQRQLAQQRVERLAEAQLVGASRAPRARRRRRWRARTRCRWSMSTSTEMRSKERLTHTPVSRSSVSAVTSASVWTKQNIVAKRGWIIRRPSPVQRRTRPAPSSTSSAARFGPLSLVRIAAEKSAASSPSAARGVHAAQDVSRQLDPDHSGGRHADLRGLHAQPLGGSRLHRERRVQAAPAVPDVRAAGVRDHRSQAPEVGLPRHDHRGADPGVRGEARGGDRVRESETSTPTSRPSGFSPAGHARGAEPGRERVRVELGDVRRRLDPARPEERRRCSLQPSASGKPSIRLRSCTAWPAAPFQRLSIAQNASTRSFTTATWTVARFVSRTSRVRGG